jgi:putative transposase
VGSSLKTPALIKRVFWQKLCHGKGVLPMKKSKFTEEQNAFALRQTETGTRAAEVCRKLGIVEHTLYRWKKKYIGLGVSELRRLKQVEDENRKLKQLVADLSCDKQMLQDVLSKKL